MSERLCQCGNKLSSMNRSVKCYVCKEKAAGEMRRQAGQKILEEAKARGLVQLHSCISNLFDPAPKTCRCRRFVTFQDASEFIKFGLAVDFRTRESFFHERAIVVKSKLKNPPTSSVGSRVAIERKIVAPFDERTLTMIRATVEEDRILRAAERDLKIELENEITREERSKLICDYSPEEWDAVKRVQRTLPTYISGVGCDERSSTGKTRKSERINYEDTEEFYAKALAIETEINKDIQSPQIADDDAAPAADENEIDCESTDAITEMAEAA